MSGPVSKKDWALARRQSTDAVLGRIERRKARKVMRDSYGVRKLGVAR